MLLPAALLLLACCCSSSPPGVRSFSKFCFRCLPCGLQATPSPSWLAASATPLASRQVPAWLEPPASWPVTAAPHPLVNSCWLLASARPCRDSQLPSNNPAAGSLCQHRHCLLLLTRQRPPGRWGAGPWRVRHGGGGGRQRAAGSQDVCQDCSFAGGWMGTTCRRGTGSRQAHLVRIRMQATLSHLLNPAACVPAACPQALSPVGRCQTFDAAADGYGRGEGFAAVVLTRQTATSSSAASLAVVRGSAVNSAGRSSGLTSPSGPAQQALVAAALTSGSLSAADVAFLAVHGTGTALGDPIEVGALGGALAAQRVRPLALGSSKSCYGHTEGSAGE